MLTPQQARHLAQDVNAAKKGKPGTAMLSVPHSLRCHGIDVTFNPLDSGDVEVNVWGLGSFRSEQHGPVELREARAVYRKLRDAGYEVVR